MRWLVGLILASTAAVADAKPHGNPAFREHETCLLSTVAFADARHGWLADHCGAVFESIDAGESWKKVLPLARGIATGPRRSVRRFVWFTASAGLALVDNAAQAYRTTNAGVTWSSVPMPLNQELSSIDVIGARVWACGSGGVARSLDGGRSWKPVGALFTGRPACASVSFSDEQTGRASGGDGTLFDTYDGGDTWRARPSAWKGPALVVRLTRTLGFVESREGSFRTSDGGAHFERLPDDEQGPSKLFVHQIGGRTFFSTNEASTIDALRGVTVSGSRWGADGAVSVDGQVVSFYRLGALRRATPPLARVGANASEPIEVVSDGGAAEMRHGWSARHVYESRDGGVIWFVVGDVPATIQRLAPVGGLDLVAQTTGGWYRSDDQGREWMRSSSPDWDAYELSVATNGKTINPMACLATAPDASVEVVFGVQGCFGSTKGELSLRLAGGLVTMAGTRDSDEAGKQPTAIATNPTVASFRSTASRLIEVAARAQKPAGCGSTSETFSHLTWSCGGAANHLTFSSYDCDSGAASVGGSVEAHTRGPAGYSRASGVNAVARGADECGAAAVDHTAVAAIGMLNLRARATVLRPCRRSGLIHDELVPDREALVELVSHGIRYLMPAERGAATRGMPTSYGVSPLKELFANGDSAPPVWPDPQGTVRGESLQPIYRSVPEAARQDPKLHECLALVDALRAGRARERNLAEEHFRLMINPVV